ncbi:hypothetical protein YC2023_033546 [Brassica napus]
MALYCPTPCTFMGMQPNVDETPIYKLTSYKSPANAPIFNRSTSRTNLLKPLKTATARIHKLPQPQPPCLNQSDPKSHPNLCFSFYIQPI